MPLAKPSGTGFALALTGAALLLCASVLGTRALGATYTWDGGGADNNITTAQNWVGDIVPAANSDIIWAGSVRLNVNIDIGGPGRTFTFNNTAGAFIIGGAAASLSNGITNNSTNTETLNIPLTLTGAQTSNAASGNLVFGGTTLANGGFLLTIDGLKDTSIANVISGTGGLTKTGAGTLTLTGVNTYAGITTITAGTLLLQTNAALGSGSSDILIGNTTGANSAGLLTNSSVTISRNIRAQSGNTGVLTLGGNSATTSTFSGSLFLGTNSSTGKSVMLTALAGGTTTFSGVIQDPTGVSGPGLLTKNGAGTVVLSGVNTYAGGTSIDGGTLSISQVANLGGITGGLTINAGTLEISSGFSTSRAITLGDATSTFQIDPSQIYSVTSGIAGSGTGALNKTGTGTMVLSGVNTYVGATNIMAGTLRISANERILNTSDLNVSGGTFDVQTFSETVRNVTLSSGSITGSGAGKVTASSYAVQSGTVTAILAGVGTTMTKTTAGIVTLSGVNTFTGATTVSGGTLTLASGPGGALGSTSGVTVNSGGTLLLGADNQINNTASITLAGGTFAKGNFSEGSTSTAGVGALILTATGSHLDFGTGTVGTFNFSSFTSGGNTLTIDNWTGAAATLGTGLTDRLIFTADQSANLASFNFTGFGPGAMEFNLGGGYFEITPVPETGTYIAGLVALALIPFHHRKQLRGLFDRRRKKHVD